MVSKFPFMRISKSPLTTSYFVHLTFLFLVCVFSLPLHAQNTATLPKNNQFVLDNGLKVVVVQTEGTNDIYLRLHIDRPLVQEKEAAGAGEMIGELLNEQAEKIASAEQLPSFSTQINLSSRGAEVSAKEEGISSEDGRNSLLRSLLKVISNTFLAPDFNEEALSRAKANALAFEQMNLIDPHSITQRLGHKLVFGSDHPYGEYTTVATLEAITPTICRNFYHRYYRPSISTLVLVGDLNPRQAKRLVEQSLGDWQGVGVMQAEYFDVPLPAKEQTINFVGLARPAYTSLRWNYARPIQRDYSDMPVLAVLAEWMSNNPNTQVALAMAEYDNPTTDLKVSWQADSQVSLFSGLIRTPTPLANVLIKAFCEDLENLHTNLVDKAELEAIKNGLLEQIEKQAHHPAVLAEKAYALLKNQLDANYFQDYLIALAAVSPAQLREAAQTYLPEEKLQLVVASQHTLGPLMASYSPTATVNYYAPDGSRIYEVGQLLPEKLSPESIIEHYLEAIGGKEKLAAITELQLQWDINISGLKMRLEEDKRVGSKLYRRMIIYGDTVSSTILNGEQVAIREAGVDITADTAMVRVLKEQAQLFPELHYLNDVYQLKLLGIMDWKGRKAYQIEGVSPDGHAFTAIYEQATGLKMRQTTYWDEQAIHLDFMDYRKIDGILLPYRLISSNGADEPYVLELKKAIFNPELDDSLFDVE